VKLKDKIVAITGAASGLGTATAVACAQEGAKLFLIDCDVGRLDAPAAKLAASGAQCQGHVTDISSRDNCFAAIAAAVERFGKLDGLCNVAGIVQFHHACEVTEADWNRMIAVNLSGSFFLCQAAIPELIKEHGSIVNVASSGGMKGTPYTVPYSITKAGIIQMTKALAREFIKQPIRINVMAPGAMDTEMNANLVDHVPEGIDRSLMAAYSGFRPMADPMGMARMIAYMISDETPAMHGAVIAIDAGITAG
jgi:meso-butanediol dehydrogenase / (S,S)-butanediol dehydrogenase / diacetyl reductase